MTMCVPNTPVTHHPELGLYVKHEEECCPGGPNFSKTRGVFARVASRPEQIIGVLDTSHSQGGWAVAKACSLLGKQCVLFYPVRKHHEFDPLQPQQQAAQKLGAKLVELPAGRSAILYHRAKKLLSSDGYLMPNALKLLESVDETAAEFKRTTIPKVKTIVVSASSGTIAAGVCRGAHLVDWRGRMIVHMGYSRPQAAVRRYIEEVARVPSSAVTFVDEGYSYADKARPGVDPPFPCNSYYDLKAYRWICANRTALGDDNIWFWNIG